MATKPADLTTRDNPAASTDQARPEWSVARKVPRRWRIALATFVLLAGAGVAVVGLVGRSHKPFEGPANGSAASDLRVPVVTIRPKNDPHFQVAVRGLLATVKPFYQAHLRSRVAGVVKAIHKDIGDPVRRGEVLVEIDVPDLEQDVALKERTVTQRQQEVLVAQAQVRSAEAKTAVADAEVLQRQAAVKDYESKWVLQQKRLARFRSLAGNTVATPAVVDEEEQATAAAAAAVESAKAAVKKAEAERADKEASLVAARADVKLAEALVAVAATDLERARTLAGYARIEAPFDGVVIWRGTDPGEFVHNSSAGSGVATPLLTVARTDLVTVTVKLPDNAAPFVTEQTVAELRLNDLPGLTIRAPVTRQAPAIVASDRTMTVEIDLFNGSEEDYRRFVARAVAAELMSLAPARPLGAAVSTAAGWFIAHRDQKGLRDRLPARPKTVSGGPLTRRLIPGMTGYVRLNLDSFAEAYLLPSSAVFSRGGQPYILVVRDGVTKLVPVQVQVNDGRLAKVAVVQRVEGREVLSELKGTEDVVASRQLEVGEGQAVRATPQEW